ncbi:MAG: tyrosine--tRNA ligase [Planctomycetaceae bacterium]|nr:tyrosine--tRNA ligase [Planctomycetaceae bacterium]
MSFPPVDEQLAIIHRGVDKIVPEEELAAKLEQSRKTNTPLRIKYGIDPTGIDLHLGHTVPLRKMRQFQELGHQAVIIIGNYTALVGDPSGRDETRARLTAEQVEANAQDYLKQVGKVIDLENAEVHRNGDWFAPMNFSELLELCSTVTVAQLLTRDDFSKRYKNEQPIYLHECLYPLMQAWDSVKIAADVELGGTEQLYSFMLARDLQGDAGMNRQIGVMSPILVGTDGVRRMGKSLGNYIGISEPAYEMMKKFMQLSDESMRMFFELLTDLPLEDVDGLLEGHPKEAKVTLAKTIIGQYHDADQAVAAAERWQKEIGGGALPEEIPVGMLHTSQLSDDRTMQAGRLLKEVGLCKSTSEAMRAISQGGAYFGENKTRFVDRKQEIKVDNGLLLWVGKKRVCRVELMDEE